MPEKILSHFLANVDCTTMNSNVKVQKINNIIAAWRHRDLSYKGRALIINTLLTCTLWYNMTSLPVPYWAIAQIEQAINVFFCRIIGTGWSTEIYWPYPLKMVASIFLASKLRYRLLD